MMRVGIAPTLIGTRGARPALRISGRRRLSRLVENVGEPPATSRRSRSGPASEPVAPAVGRFASARPECEIVSCRRLGCSPDVVRRDARAVLGGQKKWSVSSRWLTRTAAQAATVTAVRRLVIVESPTKARKIAGYLGSNYIVESSRGHIRDLPRAAADVPAKYKSEPWARLGVNVDADFEPLYIVSPDKKSTVAELKDLLKDVDELYLATDGDREGEAIAWHLLETLKPRIPVKRMVFHEITEPAIRAAAEDPRDLDIDLVDAQETRRILDRLYGYEVSPVLWKKVAPKLSAGRVQSVATRIIVSARTRADGVPQRRLLGRHRRARRQRVRSAGVRRRRSPPSSNTVDGRRVATGRDFDSLGAVKKPDEVLVLDEAAAGAGHRPARRAARRCPRSSRSPTPASRIRRS